MESPTKLKLWIYRLSLVTLVLLIMWLVRVLMGDFLARFMQAFIAILLPFSIALFISYLVAPLFRVLERRLYFKSRLINTFILFIGTGFLLYFFGRYIGTLVYAQGVRFIESDWPQVQQAIEGFFIERPFLLPIYENMEAFLGEDLLGNIQFDFVSLFESLAAIIITVVLVPVFLFFILNDRDRIYEALIGVVPKKYRYHAIELTKRANHVTEQYFNGRFLTMFIMTIISTIVFFIMGFQERSLLFGFMMGFFDIVPYVGPFIASLVPFLYSLTDSNIVFGDYAPVMTLVAVIVMQVFENNILQPVVMSNETKIHPLLVLSAFIFFGYLLGVVGIILAIPITGMIRSTFHYLREIHQERIALDSEEKEHLKERPEETPSDS